MQQGMWSAGGKRPADNDNRLRLKNKDLYNISAYVYVLSSLGDLIPHAAGRSVTEP